MKAQVTALQSRIKEMQKKSRNDSKAHEDLVRNNEELKSRLAMRGGTNVPNQNEQFKAREAILE